MQVASALSPTGGFSEDCLYLNIWRPAAASDKPVPVVVWIPGGGLVRGGASLYPFDNFARKGVAVVTVSCRLGRFGFFAHPALAKEAPNDPRGNYGFMDQIAALKWVKANIAAFGGDPNNVTLAGESAGGGSVLVQLTSPLSRGLFQRAIAQSPGTPSARAGVGAMSDLASAETIAVEWAQAQGINGDDAAALAALRALPVEVLTAGTDPDSVILGIFGGPRVPGVANAIIDGRLIVDPPEVAFPKGEWARVPVIVGANDADLAVTAAKNKDELFASFGPRAAEVRALYDPNGDATLATLIQTALADRNMVEPSRNLADLTVKAGQPAYFFRFSYVPEVQRGKVPGATHGAEIAFAFDVVSAALGNKASAADLAMAEKMSAYWLAFMKTGNPNGAGRPQWSTYDPATRDVLNFTNEGVKFGADPLKERLDLWKSVWEQNK